MLRERPSACSEQYSNWAERSEYWLTLEGPKKRGAKQKFKYREPLILCGHGIRIRVDHNTLVVRNGLTHYPQKAEEIRYFPGEANLPGRIVALDGSGGATFDALQWMAEQSIEFLRLGWDGKVVSLFGNSGYSATAKLVEMQQVAKSGRRNLEIANWLIQEKLKASLLTLNSAVPNSEFRQFAIGRISDRISDLRIAKSPISISKLFGIEGDCARAYFRAWDRLPVQWKGLGRKPIPTDWHMVGSRMMTWRKRARLPRHPINAMLNYAYGILVHQLRAQVVAAGLDPTIGVLHGNSENPIPLVYDIMEPLRPLVDRAILQFTLSQTFAPGDFAINRSGACRLNPQIARQLVSALIGRHPQHSAPHLQIDNSQTVQAVELFVRRLT